MQNWNDINGDFHSESAMDFLPREQLRRIQSQRLSEIVKLAYERVPLHRARMDKLGVKPSDIKSIDDISKLPFTQKSDLARYLSLRNVRGGSQGHRAPARFERHHRKTDCRGVYAGGHGGMVELGAQMPRNVRRQTRGFHAGMFRLRLFTAASGCTAARSAWGAR